jgi:vacuolar-type H+-ATPase subunit B/Vma2
LSSLYVVVGAPPTVEPVVPEVRGNVSGSGLGPRTRVGPATKIKTTTRAHFATAASNGSVKSPVLATSGETRNRLVAP